MTAALMDIQLDGDTAGINRMLGYLELILSPVGMMGFLHYNIGPYLQSRARDRFMSEGDDVTGPWQALTSSTVARRQRMGYPGHGPINVRTGELERYITQSQFKTTPHSLGATLQFPKDSPRGRGIREKMATAQMGRQHPSTLPRPVLGLNERDLLFVVSTLAFYIQQGGGRV